MIKAGLFVVFAAMATVGCSSPGGGPADAAAPDGQAAVCGDGLVQPGESCDLGAGVNGAPGQPCSTTCMYIN